MNRTYLRILALTALISSAMIVAVFFSGDLREGEPSTLPAQTLARRVSVLVNELRLGQGLPALRRDAVLASLAHSHNHDMIVKGFFAHDDPQGQSFYERLAYLHRSLVGEVQAWGTGGFGSPAGLVNLWMASREHRANLLRREFKRIGCSVMIAHFQGERAASLATCDFSN